MPLDAGNSGGTGWSAEQKRNAAIIIQQGKKMGMSRRDIVIGLMTAMQESSLRNLNHGDRDSLGLFQQRPSMGWGTAQQVTDPVYSSRKFFSELKKVQGRNNMRLTEAAQAVQRSAYPDAYAKWENDARRLIKTAKGKITPRAASGKRQRDPLTDLADGLGVQQPQQGANPLGGDSLMPKFGTPDLDLSDNEDPGGLEVSAVDTSLGDSGAPGLGAASPGAYTGMMSFGSPDEYVSATGGGRLGQKGVNNTRQGIVELAKTVVGVPYKWGGSDLTSGVDCSGFIQSVYKQMGIDIPRVSYQQANFGKRVGLNKLQAGDLVAWDNSSRNNGADHVAIYLGNGRIIEAAKPGTSVRIRKLRDNEGAWGVAMKVK